MERPCYLGLVCFIRVKSCSLFSARRSCWTSRSHNSFSSCSSRGKPHMMNWPNGFHCALQPFVFRTAPADGLILAQRCVESSILAGTTEWISSPLHEENMHFEPSSCACKRSLGSVKQTNKIKESEIAWLSCFDLTDISIHFIIGKIKTWLFNLW